MGFLAAAVVHGGLINIFSNLTMMAGASQDMVYDPRQRGMWKELEKRSREFTALIYRQVGAVGEMVSSAQPTG